MTFEDFMKSAFRVLAVVGLCSLCFVGGSLCPLLSHQTKEKVKVDTLTIRDTIVRVKPEYRTIRVIDTMEVAVTNTIVRHDTTFVKLPKEEKVYEDSTYYAVVSGYKPSLDTLKVYRTTTEITKFVKMPYRRKWGVGATAGPSIVVSGGGKVYGGIGASVGLTYSF